ncbi:hypothetical protein SDC9_179286 [bioreactor metagenome]|uniref:Uncharacterized protein n=1 Tax=bioreactor metagenome TaxID=1076179 RepID=A0A645GY78_9ZZZZ
MASPSAPLPSAFAGRPSRRTQCGWGGSSSRESSTTTSRWSGGTRPSRVPSTVVLPVPVPPLTRNASRCSMIPSSSVRPTAGSDPRSTRSARVNRCRDGTRSEMHVPGSATEPSTACTRVPSGSRASTQGAASSRRRPTRAARRSASRRTSSSEPNTREVRSSPWPRSIQTWSGPLTSTSVTPGSASSGSRTPAPYDSRCRRSTAS